jgi:hypothetical protein
MVASLFLSWWVLGAAQANPAVPTDAAAEVAALPAGGAWTREVRRILLRHDADASGSLDQPNEIGAISCALWGAIDAGVRRDWRGHGLLPMYGFVPGQLYVGDTLGIDARLAPAVWEAVEACDKAPATTAPPGERATTPERLVPPPATIANAIDGLQRGGSDAWDEAVRQLLLATYDADRNDSLGAAETLELPCPVWEAINRGVRSGWADDVGIVYGFRSDLIWIGGALGLHEDARQAAHDAAERCLGAPPLPGTLRL